MTKPLVAIVGRPNVGKSTLFNRLIGRRVAIVEDTPGVTRDRVYADCEWLRYKFTVIDTGGIDPKSEDALLSQMRRQAEIAIEMADVICFFTDAKTGMTHDDADVADLLRRTKKPVVLVVNKMDSAAQNDSLYEFYAHGLGDPMGISSTNMLGLGDLLDRIVSLLPACQAPDEEDEGHVIQLAVVGRPNVGKSSLVNRLLGQERTMVSDIPGTTRDAVDTLFTAETGVRYNIIDTAGIRRKRAIDESLEHYSVLRAIGAIRRCDVALMLLDANEGVTEQDARIAGMIHEEGKGAVVVVNKWDAVEKETGTLEKTRKQVLEDLKFMDYAPVLFISALTGKRANTVLQAVDSVYLQFSRRVPTGALNDVIGDAQISLQPPVTGGKRLKIYYATQVSACPPNILLFVNDRELMHFSYERYLENSLRKAFGFEGTPLRLSLREKNKEDIEH